MCDEIRYAQQTHVKNLWWFLVRYLSGLFTYQIILLILYNRKIINYGVHIRGKIFSSWNCLRKWHRTKLSMRITCPRRDSLDLSTDSPYGFYTTLTLEESSSSRSYPETTHRKNIHPSHWDICPLFRAYFRFWQKRTGPHGSTAIPPRINTLYVHES